MIPLVAVMLRARWAAALTLVLLALFATAAAVAGPAYLGAVDRSVVRQEVTAAAPNERSLSATTAFYLLAGGAPNIDLTGLASSLVALPGVQVVYSAEIAVLGTGAAPPGVSRLVFRQDVCSHLVIVAGRCVTGVSEAVLGEATARRLKVGPGDVLTLTDAVSNPDPAKPGYVPAGKPAPLTVAGIYRPRDRGELYWARQDYFAVTTTGQPDEPLFTSRAALGAIDHPFEEVNLDALAGVDTFAPERLGALRGALQALQAKGGGFGDAVKLDTDLPTLLDRIERSRSTARQVVPVAAVPLVVLAWFVIYLAVGYGTEGRRGELALVALRGARLPTRWWLAAGEAVVPIAAGTVLGYLVGPALVGLVAPGAAGTHALGYGVAAGAGAVLAALAAGRRELVTPVVDLLRRVPPAMAAWRGLAVEVIVVVLAIVAAVQLRVSGGQLVGLGMLVPALVMAGVAVLAARALRPLASRYGTRALRRGRVGLALAAVQLGRRPGVQRLFVLLVVAVALLGFAAAGGDVANRARADRATVQTGALRVLTVDLVSRTELLDAVRAVDPAGRFAMAVTGVPAGAPGELPKLAVDATRLAAVAVWRPDFGPLGAARAAELLRPPAPAPTVVRGDHVELDVTDDPADAAEGLHIGLTMAPLGGGTPIALDLGGMVPGPHTYRAAAPDCRAGCRMVGIRMWAGTIGGYDATATFRALRGIGPDGVAVPAARFTPDRWRPASKTALDAVPDGLRARITHANGGADEGWIRPVDGPYPLPVVTTGSVGTSLAGLDSDPVPVTRVGTVSGLPRLGRHGVLVDLEYADRLATDADAADDPEVWLGPAAPPDVVDRLAAHGLVILSDRSATGARTALAQQGPALALRFHLLAALFAVLLAAGGIGLVATVDRGRRVEDLAALRYQGVRAGPVGRAARWGYLAIVLAALAVGLAAAAVAWWVSGWALPVFVDAAADWPVPRWPRPVPVLWPVLAAGVALLGTGWLVAARLNRAIRRRVEGAT